MAEKPKEAMAQDYEDIDLQELQKVVDYITQRSIPQGMTLVELQGLINIFSDFTRVSLSNLNLLRGLAGDPPLPIQKDGLSGEGE